MCLRLLDDLGQVLVGEPVEDARGEQSVATHLRVLGGSELDQQGDLAGVVDDRAVSRLELLGLVRRDDERRTLALTRRGRFLGGGVTADLLA